MTFLSKVDSTSSLGKRKREDKSSSKVLKEDQTSLSATSQSKSKVGKSDVLIESNKSLQSLDKSKNKVPKSDLSVKNVVEDKDVGVLNLSKKKLSKTEVQKPPITGSGLLEWVRQNMSFISVDSLEDDSAEETTRPSIVKTAKKDLSNKDLKKNVESLTQLNKKKPPPVKKKNEEETVTEVIKLKRPPGLEDELVNIIKRNRELAKLDEKPKKKVVQSQSSALIIQKKLTPKEMQQLAKLKMEEAEEAARRAEIKRKEDELEIQRLNEKQSKEILEHGFRTEHLKKSLDFIESLKKINSKLEKQNFVDLQWKLYVNCGELPIATKTPNMNTFIHLWELMTPDMTVEDASKRTKDVTKLIRIMDDLIETKEPEGPNDLENWKWVKNNLREKQRLAMEAVTYNILRNISKMNRINLTTADFNYKDDLFTLCLWLQVQLPVPLFNPRRPQPPPVKVKLEPLEMEIEFPTQFTCTKMALRCLYLKYDHYSDKCPSFQSTSKPEYYSMNLLQSAEDEWKIRMKYKVIGKYRQYYEKELKRREGMMMENLNRKALGFSAPPPLEIPPMEKFKLPVIENENNIPVVPAAILDPTPSEYVLAALDQKYRPMRAAMLYDPDDFEVNLRKYIILGGVFNINLYYQPPQPQSLVTIETTVTPFVLPKQLEEVPYYESFKPPRPSSTNIIKTPEEIEAALKKQEEDLAKLLFITISLPKHVVYLEMPTVCMWDPNTQFWSTRDIHDVKPNEEKGLITFRASRFGCLGLAAFRYGNLPFQTWELKPELDGSITFSLTAAIIMFEFRIKGQEIKVTQLQNSPNDDLKGILNKTFTLRKLQRVLREAGIDIFPEHDAFCYVEGACEKHWPTEEMAYYDMAHISNCYNISWSRWNATEDARSILFQMRIYKALIVFQFA